MADSLATDANTARAPFASSSDSPELSRRDFFRGLRQARTPTATLSKVAATAAAVWGAAAMTQHKAQAEPRSVSGDVDKNALLAKLVSRISMGFSQAEYTLAQQMGYDAYLEYHLNPAAIDDSAMDARLASYTTLNMTPQQLYTLTAGQIVNELSEAMILRMVFSKRQLFERLVEFWTDHFNIDITIEGCRYLKPPDDKNVIRANAMGNFPTLLRASAQSACMMLYLNNDTNVAGNPNENYARELLELHTLSVTGPYTQTDVQEVARCLTGWTIYGRTGTATAGTFRYNAATHDNGSKTVLGQVIPANGGQQDGFTVLDMLSVHSATANFIAKKLCRRFLGEDVPTSIVNSVASVYTSTGGDIKAMMRAVLKPDNLYTDFGPRYKRPLHQITSALRSMGATITSTNTLRNSYLASSGQLPYSWGPPDGYPDTLAYWQGLILPRWNFGANVAINTISGISFDITAFFSGLTTAQQMIDKIDNAFFGNELTAGERAQLLSYLSINPNDTTRRRDTVGMAIGCPSFQWY